VALIVALLPHVAHSQRLRAAVSGRHEVRTAADWQALLAECETEPVQLAVIDLYADGAARFDHLRRLRASHPRITLIAYVSVAAARARDLFDAGRYGFDALIIAGEDDTASAVLSQISQAESRGVISDVRRLVEDRLSPEGRDIVLLAVTRAHERMSPSELARVLGIGQRQLGRLLVANGLPAPGRLITWGRLIVGAWMLQQEERSADNVARLLRFPSGSAFRNTCQRYLRASPNEIRKQGGPAFVLRAFDLELGTRQQP
jgi:AraC-like DNA-binding protein